MEGQVKFLSSQNTAGVSQEKGVAGISLRTVVNGDQDSKAKKTTTTTPYCSSEVGMSWLTWHVEALGRLDYFGQTVWRHFMILTFYYNCL